MSKQRILVIDDDPAIRKGILHTLRFNGYDTLEAADHATGLQLALAEAYDLPWLTHDTDAHKERICELLSRWIGGSPIAPQSL